MTVSDAARRFLSAYKEGCAGGAGLDYARLWESIEDLERALEEEDQQRLQSDYTA